MREQHLLAVVLVAMSLGCTSSTEKGKLRPEGPPEVLEVFMFENVGSGLESSTEFNLAYGCDDPQTLDCAPDAINGLDPRDQPRMRLCCDRQYYHRSDDGFVSNAVIGAGQKIRIVVDELLKGSTVEQFVCACADPPLDVPANCQGGPTASLDPLNCEDNPNTDLSEASRFSDKDLDGVPDKTDMLPGLVAVSCDGLSVPWLNQPEDGWYNPSGNQQVPANVVDSSATNVILEWDAVGPAIVLALDKHTLPSSSMCHIGFRDTSMYETKDGMVEVQVGRDKDGEAIPTPDPAITFGTEAMRVTNTMPLRNATGVPVATTIAITFNTTVDPSTIMGITVTDMATATVVDAAYSLSMDGATISVDPTADLTAATRYIVTITTSITDSYGAALPAQDTFGFTTM